MSLLLNLIIALQGGATFPGACSQSPCHVFELGGHRSFSVGMPSQSSVVRNIYDERRIISGSL